MRIKTSLIIAATAAALVVAPVATSTFTGADLAFAKGNGGGGNGGGGGGGNGGGNGGGSSGGNGGGNSGGNGGGNGGKSHGASLGTSSPSGKATAPGKASTKVAKASHGTIASELKGLNAAHASPTALANAAPNSQVGRIATYKTAVEAGMLAGKKLEDATLELQAIDERLAGYSTERTLDEIDGDLASLTEPTAPTPPEGEDVSAEDQAAYDAALAAYNGDLQSYTEATSALEAERAQAVARDADLEAKTALEAEIVTLEADVAAADIAEHDALLVASNGRELSPEALAELNRLLDPQMPAEVAATTEDGATE